MLFTVFNIWRIGIFGVAGLVIIVMPTIHPDVDEEIVHIGTFSLRQTQNTSEKLEVKSSPAILYAFFIAVLILPFCGHTDLRSSSFLEPRYRML